MDYYLFTMNKNLTMKNANWWWRHMQFGVPWVPL